MVALIVVVFAFFEEMKLLLKKPQYRSMLLWVGVLLLIGTIFFNRAEGWGWLDSLYFCVVTLATIGYGDLVPTTEMGKAFTIVYALLGLGIIATFASMLARERFDMASKRRGAPDEEGKQAA